MGRTVLIHHGIKGQHWGMRRYQYEDGSLTPEGKIRYGVEGDGSYDSLTRKQKRAIKRDNKTMYKQSKEHKKYEYKAGRFIKKTIKMQNTNKNENLKKIKKSEYKDEFYKNLDRAYNVSAAYMTPEKYREMKRKINTNKAIGTVLATAATSASVVALANIGEQGTLSKVGLLAAPAAIIAGTAGVVKAQNDKIRSEYLDQEKHEYVSIPANSIKISKQKK